ncbi:nucleotidyltransferase domain-containing protein [bacterium]|nr:nucleotidyltransferase domain-containing protein [bacterium]
MINLKRKHFNELCSIFEKYCPKAEIWAYGSRIHGDSHDGSDLDMTVKNFNDPNKKLWELKELLDDSDIPFLMDISEFDRLPGYFQSEILKNYIKLFPAEESTMQALVG